MRAPPLIPGKTKPMPVAGDATSVRARLVSAQLLPLMPRDRDIYLCAGVSVLLPSGRAARPALAAYRISSGPTPPDHIARTVVLIVDVVGDDADLAELETDRAEYQTLPALVDYVRVGLTRRAVVVYARADGWQRRAFTRGAAPLLGLGGVLRVGAIYP